MVARAASAAVAWRAVGVAGQPSCEGVCDLEAEAAVTAEVALAEASAIEPVEGRAAAFLDCEGLGQEHLFWPVFREAFAQGGPLGPDAMQLAYAKWTEWEQTVEAMEEAGQLSGKVSVLLPGVAYANGSTVETQIWDRLDLVRAIQRSHFQSLFGDPPYWGPEYLAGFLSCPVGFVLVQYVVFIVHKVRSHLPLRDRMVNWESMSNAFGLILGLPPYALDFLESSGWGIKSHDMVVNLNAEDGGFFHTYEDYCRSNPVPPPVLRPWRDDAPQLARFASSLCQAGDSCAKKETRALCTPDSSGALRIALVGEHGATNMDHLSSVSAAIREVCADPGFHGGGSNDGGVNMDAAHFFTYLWNLAGTAEGDALRAGLRMSWEAFWGEPLTESQGRRSVAGPPRWTVARAVVALEAFVAQEPFLQRAQLIVCCEPLWLCVLLHAAIGGRRLLVRASMCLLHAFSHIFGADELDNFWPLVRDFTADMAPRGTISAAARISAEMLVYQAGLRAPYVPALSLHLLRSAPYAPASAEVLMFRSQLPSAPSFRRLLKLLAASWPGAPRIVDMPQGMSFSDIASFRAVAMLPHVPHALRLSDVYAMGLPTLVPADPLIHKFVWPYAGPFCGRTDPELSRTVDLLAPNRSEPPFSPFAFQREEYDAENYHGDRRYWLQYTEWELRPHLLRFSSARELLELAAGLSQEEAWEVSARVRSHHAELVREALAYWRAAALAASLAD